MADSVNHIVYEIARHVPTVTWAGLSMAGVLGLVYLAKRYNECALLAAVCAAYAVSPYLVMI